MWPCMQQGPGQYLKQISKRLKHLKCGYGEGWKSSVGQQKLVILKFWVELMEDRCIINMTKQQKCKWLGHVLCHDVLLRHTLEGRMTGKCTRGRKRLQLMSNICNGSSYKSVKKWAEDRCLWRVLKMEVNDLLFIAVHKKKKKKKKKKNWRIDIRYCKVNETSWAKKTYGPRWAGNQDAYRQGQAKK